MWSDLHHVDALDGCLGNRVACFHHAGLRDSCYCSAVHWSWVKTFYFSSQFAVLCMPGHLSCQLFLEWFHIVYILRLLCYAVPAPHNSNTKAVQSHISSSLSVHQVPWVCILSCPQSVPCFFEHDVRIRFVLSFQYFVHLCHISCLSSFFKCLQSNQPLHIFLGRYSSQSVYLSQGLLLDFLNLLNVFLRPWGPCRRRKL